MYSLLKSFGWKGLRLEARKSNHFNINPKRKALSKKACGQKVMYKHLIRSNFRSFFWRPLACSFLDKACFFGFISKLFDFLASYLIIFHLTLQMVKQTFVACTLIKKCIKIIHQNIKLKVDRQIIAFSGGGVVDIYPI